MVFADLDDKADNRTYRLQGKVCVHKGQLFFSNYFIIYIFLYIYRSSLPTTLASFLSADHHSYNTIPSADGEVISLNAASSVFVCAAVKEKNYLGGIFRSDLARGGISSCNEPLNHLLVMAFSHP